MDLSLNSIAAGFFFGVWGMYVLKRGKNDGDLRWIGIGVALIAYGFFVSNAILVWVIGSALLGLAYLSR